MRKIEVGFRAEICYSLDESERDYILTHRDRIVRKATILTFSKLEDKDGSILRIEKVNPVLRYCVAFYRDLIIVTGFAWRHDTLKDFPEIAIEEITWLIGNVVMKVGSGPNLYTR